MMPKVIYGGQSYECGEKSVLECLTAQGVLIHLPCRSGLCQTCMMQAISGRVPEKAKAWLNGTLNEKNYFLPCICYPQEDIEVALPDVATIFEYLLSGKIE
jgi:CDP-4-dehydro-6-deoxyglucose reductase